MSRTRCISFALFFMAACHGPKETATKNAPAPNGSQASSAMPAPPVMVYRTREDMNDLVPVILSEDGTRIVSYPHPSDLRGATGYTKPTSLHHGYLLDNRGINGRVAFLGITYEAYSAMQEAPPVQKLLAMIKFKDPLLEMCDCGSRKKYTDPLRELNEMIDTGALRKTCKVIK